VQTPPILALDKGDNRRNSGGLKPAMGRTALRRAQLVGLINTPFVSQETSVSNKTNSNPGDRLARGNCCSMVSSACSPQSVMDLSQDRGPEQHLTGLVVVIPIGSNSGIANPGPRAMIAQAGVAFFPGQSLGCPTRSGDVRNPSRENEREDTAKGENCLPRHAFYFPFRESKSRHCGFVKAWEV